MYLFCTLYRFICSIGCTLISCFQNIWKYWRGFNLSTLSWGMLNSSTRKEHFDWLNFLLPSWYIILSFFAFSFLLFSSLISLLSSLFTCRYSLLSFSSSLSCTIAFSSLSLSGSSAILGGILDIVASWLSPLLKPDNSKSDPSSQAKLNCVIVPLRSYYMWLTFQTTCA